MTHPDNDIPATGARLNWDAMTQPANESTEREWRSAAFWHSDIEDAMNAIHNEAIVYRPSERPQFYRDVIAAINEYLEDKYQ